MDPVRELPCRPAAHGRNDRTAGAPLQYSREPPRPRAQALILAALALAAAAAGAALVFAISLKS